MKPMIKAEFYNCTTCGTQTHFEIVPTAIENDRLKDYVKCTNCREVELRLPAYLRSQKGLAFVKEAANVRYTDSSND